MTNRVVNYYQFPCDPGFVAHMINETGLSERDRGIVKCLREHTAETQFYADTAGMPVKAYNDAAAHVHQRMMAELLRLAQLGLAAEKAAKK